MNILVVGVGAVGGYFGAKLAKSGANVTFLARGKSFDILNSEDLKIKSFDGDFSLKVNVVDNLDSVDNIDLVLLCVKSYDTVKSVDQISSVINKDTIILSLQNGVENGEIIRRIVGFNNVLAGVVMILAEVVEPWTIDHSASGKIIFGELDGMVYDRAEKITKIFDKAEIPNSFTTNIHKELWKKLVWNAAFNSTTTLTNSVTREVLSLPETKALAINVMEEVLEVANKIGYDIDSSLIEEYIRISQNPGFAKTSMFQDKSKGKQLEIDAINGAVIKFGDEYGVLTPYNKTLYSLLKLINVKMGA